MHVPRIDLRWPSLASVILLAVALAVISYLVIGVLGIGAGPSRPVD